MPERDARSHDAPSTDAPSTDAIARWLAVVPSAVVAVRRDPRRVRIDVQGDQLGPGTVVVQPREDGHGFVVLDHLAVSYVGRELPPGFRALLEQAALTHRHATWEEVAALAPATADAAGAAGVDSREALGSVASMVARLRSDAVVDVGMRIDPAPWLAELDAVAAGWIDEPQRGVAGRGWRSLALRNRGGRAGVSIAADDAAPDLAWAWTAAGVACERIRADLAPWVVLEKCGAVHAMALAPGGHVAPHSDAPGADVEASLNIALRHPVGCRVVFGLEPGGLAGAATRDVPFEPGRGYLLDVARWHRVDNPTDGERIHLVVRTPWPSGVLGRMAGRWRHARPRE